MRWIIITQLYNTLPICLILPVLAIVLIYGSSTMFNVFAVPPDSGFYDSRTCGAATTDPRTGEEKLTCCWKETERGPYPKIGTREVMYCQTCTFPEAGPVDCKPKVAQISQITGDEITPPLEALPQLQQDPKLGSLEQRLADQGVAGLPLAAEDTQPAIVEENPVCPEGQVLDEESGLCILAEPEQQSGTESQAEERPQEEQSNQEEQTNNEEQTPDQNSDNNNSN